MKERLKLYIEGKVAKVQALDNIVIPEIQRNRGNYTKEQVFSTALEVLLEATKGMGLIEFLERNYELDEEERKRMEDLKKSYPGLRENLIDIYRFHCRFGYSSKN